MNLVPFEKSKFRYNWLKKGLYERRVDNGAGERNDSSERRWWCHSKVCAEDAADCAELPSHLRSFSPLMEPFFFFFFNN